MTAKPQEHLELQVERTGEAAIVHVRGDVSLYEVDRLRNELQALAAMKVRRIVLELSKMMFICSEGLGVIISAHIQCRHHQGRVDLVSPRATIRSLLTATRLTEMFPIYESVADALNG